MAENAIRKQKIIPNYVGWMLLMLHVSWLDSMFLAVNRVHSIKRIQAVHVKRYVYTCLLFSHTRTFNSIFYLPNCFTHLFLSIRMYEQLHKYNAQPSAFSRSDGYQNFFYYPTIFFGTVLPFVVLSILNGFLIWTVRKSHKMRHAMTNTRQVLTSNAIYS